MQPAPSSNGYPQNPVLVRVWRRDAVESLHRGAWCLVDTGGTVLEGGGDWEAPFFVRSTVKALQALPLHETGAAERFQLTDEELVLAMASHGGEPCHTQTVRAELERLGLAESDLRCGAHPPMDGVARRALVCAGVEPSQLHNNCSGKHAGFLALAKHLGTPLEDYIDPGGEGQQLVRAALADLAGMQADELVPALDGCSAPTYRLPLRALGLAYARLSSPDGLAPARRAACERMLAAVRAHPVLLAGSRKRLDSDLVRATDGRLLPKVGAEAVYVVGVRGGERALAVKIDDGGRRGVHVLVLGLLERLGLARPEELDALGAWRDLAVRNHAGLEVGRVEAVLP